MKSKLNSIVSLQDFDLINSLPCGGKAQGLSKLFQGGARVPNGICVIGDASKIEVVSAITEWLADNTAKRPEITYAVRSSAMCEDGQQHSFAGMFSTFLNMKAEKVIETVCRCQLSGENQRAKVYNAIAPTEMTRIAVVIQEMVFPRAAGVCFTANPVTKNTQEITIEVAKGLGERLVSGSVTPEYWLIDRFNRIIDMQRGDDALTGQKILEFSEVLSLVSEARRLVAKFGYPLDIEFAFGNSELFMLQARPITTLSFAV